MPERTAKAIDLDAFQERADRARAFCVAGDAFVPTSVRDHFFTDMPLLLNRVRLLQAVMVTAVRFVAAERAVDLAKDEPYEPLMAAMTAAKDAFDTAVIAALEDELS